MPKVRMPAQVDIKTRDSSTSKDSIISNGFIEQTKSGSVFTVKRPGIILSPGAANGAAQGVFYYSGKVYEWNVGVTPTSPNIYTIYPSATGSFLTSYSLWAVGTTYTLASPPVVGDDDTPGVPPGSKKLYYPTTTSLGKTPSTLTSPGNIYWRPTPYPFGSHQYYGVYNSGNGPTSGDMNSAGYSAWATLEPHPTCASLGGADGYWVTYSGIGTGFFGPNSILTFPTLSYQGNCGFRTDPIIASGYIVTL